MFQGQEPKLAWGGECIGMRNMAGVGSVNGLGERLNKQGSEKAMMNGGMQPRAEIAMQSQRPDYIPTGYDNAEGWFRGYLNPRPSTPSSIIIMPMMDALWIPAEITRWLARRRWPRLAEPPQGPPRVYRARQPFRRPASSQPPEPP